MHAAENAALHLYRKKKCRPLSVCPTTGLPDTSESKCPEESRYIEIVQVHSQ